MNSQIYMLYVTKLRKESLNNSTHINTTIIIWEKLIMAYDGGNRGPSLEQTHNVTGLNRITGSQPQHTDNMMSNENTYIHKQ